MKNLLLSVSALVLFAAPVATAQVEVVDTGGVYDSIRTWSRGTPFDQSFECNKMVSFRGSVADCSYKCNDNYCMSTCNEPPGGGEARFKLQAEDCQKDQVSIYGENGFETVVTREDYEKAGNTWLIGLLKAHSQYIRPAGAVVEVSFAFPQSVHVIGGGERRTVQAMKISGTVRYGNVRQGASFDVLMMPSEKGLKQLAIFRGDLDDYFMRQRGVKDAMAPTF